MIFRRKDGRWQDKIKINGKYKYFYSSESTEKKAIKDIQNQLMAYDESETKKCLVGQICDDWSAYIEQKVKSQTYERYKSYIRRFKEAFADININDLQPIDIDRFLNSMAYNGFASKTIRDQLNIIKQICKYAYINMYTNKNPTEFITAPKGKPKEERQALTEEEVAKIRADIFSPFGQIANFFLLTGLRKGELLALTYGDIDSKNSIITVNKSVEYIGNKPNITTPKTENGVRSVPFPDALKKFISTSKHKKDEIIFSQNGNHYSKSNFRENWKRFCKSLDIDVTPHQLRHTYATMLFEWNISEKDAQKILGHADITTTRNIYTHIRENHLQKTIDNINKNISAL